MISYVTEYRLIKARHECNSDDELLGSEVKSVVECANLCKNKFGCKYFVKGLKFGKFGDPVLFIYGTLCQIIQNIILCTNNSMNYQLFNLLKVYTLR